MADYTALMEARVKELEAFRASEAREITPALLEVLQDISKTGQIWQQWELLYPLVAKKMESEMDKFFSIVPDLPKEQSDEAFALFKPRILNALESFTGAPFTIQRICEMILKPDLQYKSTLKFMRGLEKLVLVHSTIGVSVPRDPSAPVEPESAQDIHDNGNDSDYDQGNNGFRQFSYDSESLASSTTSLIGEGDIKHAQHAETGPSPMETD
eukprot:Colp12_sorted_trinity150504_noHs@20535